MGAIMYDFSHHKLVAIVLIGMGLMTNQYWLLAGLLAFAHSSFDRMIGYGLKVLVA